MSNFRECKLFHVISNLSPTSWKDIGELIASGESVHTVGEYDETLLHVLCAPCKLQQVPWTIPVIYSLHLAGIDVNAVDKEGNTALHICSLNDTHHSIANTLIKCGADPCLINQQDLDAFDLVEDKRITSVLSHFDPGLWRSVMENDTDKVRHLLNSWCSVKLKQNGRRLLSVAEQNNCHDKVMRLLLDQRDTISLVHHALAGDLEKVEELLKRNKVDPNTRDISFYREDGEKIAWPLLAETIRLGLYDIAKALAKKADVNVLLETSRTNTTPLFIWAVDVVKDLELIKSILRKAYVSLVQDKVDFLFKAWLKNCPREMMEQFLKFGFSLSQRDKDGYTLRDRLMEYSIPDGFDAIKSNVEFVDQFVVKAVKEGNLETLEQLVSEGYWYFDVMDKKGRTMVELAEKEKHMKIVKFLNTLPTFQRGVHDLFKAVEKDDVGQVRQAGDERLVRARDRCGRSLLHLSVLQQSRKVGKHLLKRYTSMVDDKDFLGRTPLHYAVMLPDAEDIEDALLVAGADEMAQDLEGRSPDDYRQYTDPEFVDREVGDTRVLDLYLVYAYLGMLAAIESGKEFRLRDQINGLVGVNINSLPAKLGRRYKDIVFKPFLFVAVEDAQEDLAILLIELGSNYRSKSLITIDNEELILSVREAAEEANMLKLIDVLDKKELHNGLRQEDTFTDRSSTSSTPPRLRRRDTQYSDPADVTDNDSGDVTRRDDGRTTSSTCVIL